MIHFLYASYQKHGQNILYIATQCGKIIVYLCIYRQEHYAKFMIYSFI